jgi:hypothetical protein
MTQSTVREVFRFLPVLLERDSMFWFATDWLWLRWRLHIYMPMDLPPIDWPLDF